MSEDPVPDQSENIFAKLVSSADNKQHNVKAIDRIDNRSRLEQHDAHLERTLEWRGPLAFARTHGAAPGIEHHFGTRWGPNADQRVSLRVAPDGDAGLLYAYDPTWDQSALIGADVPLATVRGAFERTLNLVEHRVEEFVPLLSNVPAGRPTAGPEL